MHSDSAGHAQVDRQYRGETATAGRGNGAPVKTPSALEEATGTACGANERLQQQIAELRELLDERLGTQPPVPSTGAKDSRPQPAAAAFRLLEVVRETHPLISALADQIQRLREL